MKRPSSRWLLLGLLMVLLLGRFSTRAALAQTISPAQLATAALSPNDVPGFHTDSEDNPLDSTTSADFTAGFERVLVADDTAGTGSAALDIVLFVPAASIPTDVLQSTTANGWAFSQLSNAVNLALNGPLGVGDVDQFATWQEWDSQDNTWDTIYADSFIQGRMLVVVDYGTHSDHADPSVLLPYAQLQDSKLLTASALPQSLVAPQAVAAVPPGSAAPAAPAQPAGVVGPIAAVAQLNTATCQGGTVSLSVAVTDADGNPVPGATVTGAVQYKTTGHGFAFPATDSSGQTATAIDTGRPRGGYTVVFSAHVEAAGYSADTTAACYAP